MASQRSRRVSVTSPRVQNSTAGPSSLANGDEDAMSEQSVSLSRAGSFGLPRNMAGPFGTAAAQGKGCYKALTIHK